MKKIILFICVVAMMFVLCGCNKVDKFEINENLGRFVVVERYLRASISTSNDYRIILDRETNVLYVWMAQGITPIYNPDGSLATYKGD